MASEHVISSDNGDRPLIDLVLAMALAIVGADLIGSVLPYQWLLFMVGFLFFPALDLLRRRPPLSTDVEPGSLLAKHPNFPLLVSLLCCIGSIFLMVASQPFSDSTYKWLTFSGLFLSIAVEQSLWWFNLKKMSATHE